nr:hypothetical protein [Mycobacterium gordonae]
MSGREELRRMVNSEAPQWLKGLAQAMLDWADEISRMQAAPIVPSALPLLPPQLPPGNGQPSIPCHFCGAGQCRSWCITQTPTRGYALASIQWPLRGFC